MQGMMAPGQGPGQGPRLQIQGDRQSGQDVRSQNVMAVTAIANIVKTSLGPVGLDKASAIFMHARGAWRGDSTSTGRTRCMHASSRPHDDLICLFYSLQMLVDDIGEVTVTNDGATILKLLEVEHPAAKVLGSRMHEAYTSTALRL